MKKTKIFSILMLVVFVSLILLFTPGCKKSPKESQIIKIGVIFPLTGPAALIGEQHRSGLDLAVEKINSMKILGDRTIKLIYEDDSADPKNSISLMQKLINVERVPIVITAMSGSSMAALPIAETNKVILFANCGHPDIAKNSKWVFRNFPSSRQEVETMLPFLFETKKVKKLGILYINDSYGEGAKNVIKENVNKYGGEVVFSEPFQSNMPDQKNLLTKVLSVESDALYVFGYGDPTANILLQIGELKYKGLIVGSYNFSGPPITVIARDVIENSAFTAPKFTFESDNPKIVEFIAEYKRKFNEMPIWNTVVEYDAINILVEALKQIEEINGEKIKEQLDKIKEFDGLAGLYKKNDYGEWLAPLTIKTFKQGNIQAYQK